MTESLVSKANREKLEAEKWFFYMEAIKAGIDMVIVQGLWIALMADMFVIGSQVRKKDNYFVWEQRRKLIEMLDILTEDRMFGILPNPGSMFFLFVKPLKGALERKGADAEGEYYEALKPIPLIILTFVLPGILRVIIKQLGQIVPG